MKENFDALVDLAMRDTGRAHMRPVIGTEWPIADKLVSLPACDRYVRHRDIWDLRWLKQQGARPDLTLVTRKIEDYGETHYTDKLRTTINQLDGIVHGSLFKQEMLRFIPQDVQDRTLHRDGFNSFLANEIRGLFLTVEKALDPAIGATHDAFLM